MEAVVFSTTFISLALGIPAIYLAAVVIRIYWGEAAKALLTNDRTRADWILLGVVVSFVGTVGDGVFWQAAWSSKWLELSVKPLLFDLGPASNIGFRQVCDIAAAACHILGAVSVGGVEFRHIVLRAGLLALAAALVYGAL